MGSDDHIVLLPFLAQGHLIPFLALARQIQQGTGFIVTIATTPLNAQYLRNAISKSSSNIRLAELLFCSSDHGLPPNSENTDFLPIHHIANLCQASATLKAPFHRFVSNHIENEGKPPLCIISDVFLGWAVHVAKSVGSVSLTFTTGGAYGTAAYVSAWLNLPHRATESDEFSLPGFPCTHRFNRTHLHPFLRDANCSDVDICKWFQTQISLSLCSSGWLCNTIEEIEPLGLEILRDYIKLPVWTIGPLLPQSMLNHSSHDQRRNFLRRAGKEPGLSPERCLQWLDSHHQGSVLYICFGSQNTISPSQMSELSRGLEDSGKPFIWVIRPPIGSDMNGEFRPEWLPQGFEERISRSGRGLLVHNWAPQLEILCHKSTGAFLSHCGWNSVLESLSQGVPIIGWPLAAEQAYNSKMLEEIGVSVELTRGVQSTTLRKDVSRIMEMVMDKKKRGEEIKMKAVQIGKQIRKAVREEEDHKGSSVKAMDEILSNIVSKRKGDD